MLPSPPEAPLIDLTEDPVDGAKEDGAQFVADMSYLESLNAINSDLPLYLMSCNGRSVKVLLDSGASCSYVSPHLAVGCSVRNVAARQAETAGGHLFKIDRLVTLSLNAAGFEHDVPAYVLHTKFDLILGLDWIRRIKPSPDWEEGTWTFMVNGFSYTLRPNNTLPETNLSYLLSPRQVERLEERGQVEELFLCYMKEDDFDVDKPISDNLQSLIKAYPEVFKDQLPGLPPTRDVSHVIDTGDAAPINRAPYKMSPLELDELRKQLKELLDLRLIRPSASPWGAPVLFVRKKDGSMRMCVDYRAINQVTKRNSHPLPRIDECLEQLGGAKYFSSIDLKSGYHQVRIRDEDIPKTAFNTRYGSYEFLVLPFGLTNAPPTFQRLMNSVLGDCLDRFALVYLDDILIFSKTKEDHVKHVHHVLDRLRDAQLVANLKKCEFFKTELEFVGYLVSGAGILPSPGKVKAIREWPIPTNVQEVRQFVGLASHYRRFIRNFSTMSSALTDLTRGVGPKKRAVEWNKECQVAFDTIKDHMTSAPVLLPPDPELPYVIETDASDFGVGAVLLQEGKDGRMHPIAFESKKLSPAERNYPAQERELLGILHALRSWRCFVEGRHYIVRTDHHPLQYFRSRTKPPPPRLIRWIAELELYDPEIHYKCGVDNQVPDLLSRRDGPNCHSDEASLEPEYLYALKSIEESDWPRFYAMEESKWPEAYKDLLMKHRDKFVKHGDKVFRKVRQGASTHEIRFALFAKRADIVQEFHTSFGHAGRETVYDLIKKRWWWPGMKDDIQDWLRSCPQCQLAANADRGTHHAPMRPLDVPSAFSRWHLDFIGPLPNTMKGNNWILVAVDYATNWTIARAMPVATSQAISDFVFEEIVMKFGCPEEVLSDRGPNFMSQVLNFYLGRAKIHHKYTSAFHPRTNGKVERTNGIVKQMLRKYTNGAIYRWDNFLEPAVFACNIRKHRTTNVSPYFMVYGVEPRLPGDILRPLVLQEPTEDPKEIFDNRKPSLLRLRETRANAAEKLRANAQRDKALWDATMTHQVFNIGDMVLMRHENKFSLEYNWKGPFSIIKRNLDSDTYQIKDMNNQVYRSWVHTDRLRPIHINNKNPPTTPWYDPVVSRKIDRPDTALVEDDQHSGRGVMSQQHNRTS